MKTILQGLLSVIVVLAAVLVLLLGNVLLLIPGLLLAYTVLGIPWHWSGWIPGPLQAPDPWMAMALGLVATLVPAAADYFGLRALRLP